MAHAIMENDKGFVHGTTWHNMEEYIQLDRAVTLEEAREVMCYPLEKLPLTLIRTDAEGNETKQFPKAFSIIRTDTNDILVDAVGARFNLLQNDFLLDFVNEEFLQTTEGIEIESVGTLFNGAVSFVNINVGEFQIRGDQSPTVSRLMYCNPLGRGKYRCCAHNVRIVCNNTLRAAEAEGAANKTMARISHTLSAANRITNHMNGLVEVREGLRRHQVVLEWLATQDVDSGYVKSFLEYLFPVDIKTASDTIKRNATKKCDDIISLFENDATLNGISRTKYALLQATTNHFGNYRQSNRTSSDMVEWDALDGERAKNKDKALAMLVNDDWSWQ